VLGATVNDIIHSTGTRIALYLTIFTVAVFWLGLAYWVHRDARRRIGDPWLVGTSTLLGLVPFLGPLLYLLFRPPETLHEARAREVEIRALEAGVAARLAAAASDCPVCRSAVEPSYLICPVCTTQLKQPCPACSAPLEPFWQACPYCTAPVLAKPAAADLDAALTAEASLLRQQQRHGRAAAS
jgi:Double zinc ribbon